MKLMSQLSVLTQKHDFCAIPIQRPVPLEKCKLDRTSFPHFIPASSLQYFNIPLIPGSEVEILSQAVF